MKRVERSTDHHPPLIFTKLATKVESREMWLPIVLVEIRKTCGPPNQKWNWFSPLFILWKSRF